MERYIFLDVDGVLNQYGGESSFMPGMNVALLRESSTEGQAKLWAGMNDYGSPLPMVYRRELLPSKIGMLAHVINSANVKVVLSSSWRNYFDPEEMDVLLNASHPDWKLGTIISRTKSGLRDGTPMKMSYYGESSSRALEVKTWLKDHNKPVENTDDFRFVIIDDMDDKFTEEFPYNFLHTQPVEGLTYTQVATDLLPMLGLRSAGTISRMHRS